MEKKLTRMASVTASEAAKAQMSIFGIVRDDANAALSQVIRKDASWKVRILWWQFG